MREDLSTPVEFDPLTLYDDPYPTYRRLRDEAPVYHNRARSAWALSRFDDVRTAARDWGTFSSASGVDFDDVQFGPGDLLASDPPLHDVLRRIVQPLFAPGRIRLLEASVRLRVDELLRPLIDAGGGDFGTDFARKLPLAIVAELFGVPDSDRPLLERWYLRMQERTPGERSLQDDVRAAGSEMQAYVADAIRERDGLPTDDVLSALAAAQKDGRLSAGQSEGLLQLLLVAGIHTTQALIANGLWLLAQRPSDRRWLAADPARLLPAIEELLRFDAPVQWLGRVTTAEVELHGTAIPRGAFVMLLWASANRDDRVFVNPDALILDRQFDRHLAFGEGIHFCLGAPLARIEAKAAFEAVFARVNDYELDGTIDRMFTRQERAISRLPLRIR
jgi:cytochrome P450